MGEGKGHAYGRREYRGDYICAGGHFLSSTLPPSSSRTRNISLKDTWLQTAAVSILETRIDVLCDSAYGLKLQFKCTHPGGGGGGG